MGTWGEKNFENDTAGDWIYDLEEQADVRSFLVETLQKVSGAGKDDYIEASECYEALAAAEVICAMRSRPCTDLPDEVKAILEKHPVEPDVDLLALASDAAGRILADSELKELWDETEEDSWQKVIKDLIERLHGIA